MYMKMINIFNMLYIMLFSVQGNLSYKGY